MHIRERLKLAAMGVSLLAASANPNLWRPSASERTGSKRFVDPTVFPKWLPLEALRGFSVPASLLGQVKRVSLAWRYQEPPLR